MQEAETYRIPKVVTRGKWLNEVEWSISCSHNGHGTTSQSGPVNGREIAL